MNQRDLVRLASVHVGVPEPATTAGFLVEALELHRTTNEEGEQLTAPGDYGSGPPPSMLTLVPSGERGVTVERLVFDFRAGADPQQLVDRLQERGVEHERVGAGTTIVLKDADDIVVECRKQVPPVDALAPSMVRPRRLGHVNLAVPDSKRSAQFWSDAMGLALSERVGEFLWFLRAGSEHHTVGFRGGADRATVHHVAFEVPGWDWYRGACDRLAALGHPVEYGPGRHGPGRNIFVYLRDPSSGLRLELYADMAHIDDDEAYEPKVWDRGDRAITMNRWGPGPPESFLA